MVTRGCGIAADSEPVGSSLLCPAAAAPGHQGSPRHRGDKGNKTQCREQEQGSHVHQPTWENPAKRSAGSVPAPPPPQGSAPQWRRAGKRETRGPTTPACLYVAPPGAIREDMTCPMSQRDEPRAFSLCFWARHLGQATMWKNPPPAPPNRQSPSSRPCDVYVATSRANEQARPAAKTRRRASDLSREPLT
jgi:hypothetical protein